MSFKLYVMVSIPEPKIENVYASPLILGVYDSKESARTAWKNRPADFKDIRAKSVHIYSEIMATELEVLPKDVWLTARYIVFQFSKDDKLQMVFYPKWDGYYASLEDYKKRMDWYLEQGIDLSKALTERELCKSMQWIFYSSNENYMEQFELNKLVRVVVPLTDVNR